MLYQIYKTMIQINTEDETIAEYVSRELDSFEAEQLSKEPHMIINIHNSPPDEEAIGKTVEISAFDHISYYTFTNNDDRVHIDYYLPYPIKTSLTTGFFNPFFMPVWQRCLVDFFHNPFLGILECELLKHDATLIHASSFAFDSHGAYVLIGKGQTGKSSIVKWLGRNRNCSLLSEDFCIITKDGFVLSYPKQCRAKSRELRETDYFSSMNKMRKLLEQIHIGLFTLIPFKKFNPKRRMRFRDYFAGYDLLTDAKVRSYYILLRTSDQVQIESCSVDLFVSLCSENMKEEFQNLSAFRLYLRENDLTLTDLIDRFKDTLIEITKDADINLCNIPYYRDEKTAEKKVISIFNSNKRRAVR